MPRVAVFGFPARGHISPSLPVVAEFVRRGVGVEVHSTPAYRDLIESAGASFIAYPPGCDRLLDAPPDSAELMAHILTAADDMLPALLAAQKPSPDLVLFDASALWGGILARHLGLPCVASITTFALNRTMLQMLQAPAASAWSAPAFKNLNDEYGANMRDHIDVLVSVADLKFVYTARSFQPSGRFFDASHLFLGPLLDQRPRDGARVPAAGTRPLAYVSLGTIFNRDHALLHRISAVLSEGGFQVVVSLGNASAEPQLAWPDHVQAHAFVDQIGVLARAQLFVTHGGMNSVSEALCHGVPMIIIPQAVDQHLVARQTANLGAAVVIEPGAVSAQTLAAALARIKGTRPGFEAAAARLQHGLADVVPLAEAVDRALALINPDHEYG